MTDIALINIIAMSLARRVGHAQPSSYQLDLAEWIAADIMRDPGVAREPSPETFGANVHEAGPTALGGPEGVLREQSKMAGYTGDACGQCGNFTLKRNGSCLSCDRCGTTTGCS